MIKWSIIYVMLQDRMSLSCLRMAIPVSWEE